MNYGTKIYEEGEYEIYCVLNDSILKKGIGFECFFEIHIKRLKGKINTETYLFAIKDMDKKKIKNIIINDFFQREKDSRFFLYNGENNNFEEFFL